MALAATVVLGAGAWHYFRQSQPVVYEDLLEQATQQFQRGQARAALSLMQMAIEKDKSRWDGYEFAGRIAGTLNDYDLASSMFRKALMLAPAEKRQDVQYKLDDLKQKMERR